MKVIVYDCEIVKAIPPRKASERIEGIEYVDSLDPWRAFDQMGISVIGCYDYEDDEYRVFCEDNWDEFSALVGRADTVCGFNSLNFDNKLVYEVCGIKVPEAKSYDLLVSIWESCGLGREFNWRTHGGYGLDAVAKANGVPGKTGHGALAPVDWQQGKIGKVIDYCLHDVWMTVKLIDLVSRHGLMSPKDKVKLRVKGP